jgi:hypothetical protein
LHLSDFSAFEDFPVIQVNPSLEATGFRFPTRNRSSSTLAAKKQYVVYRT